MIGLPLRWHEPPHCHVDRIVDIQSSELHIDKIRFSLQVVHMGGVPSLCGIFRQDLFAIFRANRHILTRKSCLMQYASPGRSDLTDFLFSAVYPKTSLLHQRRGRFPAHFGSPLHLKNLKGDKRPEPRSIIHAQQSTRSFFHSAYWSIGRSHSPYSLLYINQGHSPLLVAILKPLIALMGMEGITAIRP